MELDYRHPDIYMEKHGTTWVVSGNNLGFKRKILISFILLYHLKLINELESYQMSLISYGEDK